MDFKLNTLDISAITSEFSNDKRVRVQNFITQDSLEPITRTVHQETQFNHAYHLNGKHQEISDHEIASLPPQSRQQLMQSIHQEAKNGVGFLYGRHLIGSKSPAILKDANTFLNSEKVINAIKDITGHQDICHASAQATRYLPGNFLTRHNDIVEAEGRRIAYVWGLSPKWHPDWGGLLQFYERSGKPRDAWSPEFNSLTLFDVNHIHAVTYLTPFASPRFSITGWFRSK